MATANEPAPPTLRDKINALVSLPLPPGVTPADAPGDADSVGARVKAIAAAAGISESLLNAFRLGQRDNPTKATMEKLASLYGIDPAYFTDGPVGTEIYNQLRLLGVMAEIKRKDTPVLRMAFRNHFGLSEKGASVVLSMIEQIRRLEAGGDDR